MQRYRDFAPTPMDPAGLALPDHQEWLVAPCTLSRDSAVLEESNWYAQLEMLGGESETVEIHRFGHWACGWFEIVLVHPDRALELEDIEAALHNYPILDEMDLSEREIQAAARVWEDDLRLSERVEECKEAGISIFSARGTLPIAVLDQIIENWVHR